MTVSTGARIQSNAHFGVQGQGMDDAVRDIQDCLASIHLLEYGVSSAKVQPSADGTIQIILIMENRDPDMADADAEKASEAIIKQLRKSPNQAHWRERQRELTLA